MSTEWFSKGTCHQTSDRDQFFPKFNTPVAKIRKTIATFCDVCSVKAECLEWALSHGKDGDTGIYGGKTGSERTAIRIARNRRRK